MADMIIESGKGNASLSTTGSHHSYLTDRLNFSEDNSLPIPVADVLTLHVQDRVSLSPQALNLSLRQLPMSGASDQSDKNRPDVRASANPLLRTYEQSYRFILPEEDSISTGLLGPDRISISLEARSMLQNR